MKSQQLLKLLFLTFVGLLLVACSRMKTEYYPNGKLQSQVPYRFGKEHGKAFYYENNYGKLQLEITFKNGKKEGKAVRYYLNNEIECESFYKNDLLEGKQLYFSPMGYPSMEINYHKGVKDGIYREWFPEQGTIKVEGYYKSDLLEGRWEYHDERGMLVGESNFQDGNGVLIAYDPHGNLNRKTTYKKGLRDGPEYYYDAQGNVIKTIIYKEEQIEEIDGVKTDRNQPEL